MRRVSLLCRSVSAKDDRLRTCSLTSPPQDSTSHLGVFRPDCSLLEDKICPLRLATFGTHQDAGEEARVRWIGRPWLYLNRRPVPIYRLR